MQNNLQRRDENGRWITTVSVKTLILKPSHSLDTADVHTLLHISCFQSVFSFFLGTDRAVQNFLKKNLKGIEIYREDDDYLSSHTL